MIPLPTKPKIIKKEDNKAIFEIEGLYPGYGVTIGNSLRRILLSSLEGAAITQVKIKGASHEFATLPGVMEDVLMIILNLKKLRFKLFSDDSQTAELKIKGEKDVKAKDFKLSSQTELSNTDEHIATLTKSTAELGLEVVIEKGVGFSSAESRELEKAEVGVIQLDASFSPVRKVSFSVESMRVGKKTDFDRLRIEIETDGTITSHDALKQSSDILLQHFSVLSEGFSKEAEKVKAKPTESKKETKQEKQDDVKKMKIEDLKISERTKKALMNNNIKTVSGLVKKTESALSELEGFGSKAVEETKKVLKKLGLALKE